MFADMLRIVLLLAVATALAGACPARGATGRCWIDHGALIASAAFGDIAGDFVIDLSRPQSAISVTRANAAGVTEASLVAPLVLAGRRLAAARLAVLDLDEETWVFDTTVNGVLGWDVLGAVPLELDLSHGTCRLAWGGPARRFGRGWRRFPLTLVAGAPALAAAVSDGAVTQAGLFALDTAHEEVRVAGARPALAAGDGAAFRLRAASVAGCLYEELPAAPEASRDRELSGRLGTAIFAGGRLWIDPWRRRIALDLCPD